MKEIDEEKLDDLAWEYADFHYGDGREITIQDIVRTYKAAFRTKVTL